MPMIATTSQSRIDGTLKRVGEGAREFAKLPIGKRIDLARNMQVGYLKHAEAMVKAGCAAKGITRTGEEWSLNPWMTVRHLRLIVESLGRSSKQGTRKSARSYTRRMDA